jgi:serine/threonine protein kinase
MTKVFLLAAPNLKKSFKLELLADPDRLFTLPGCQIIKDERKVRVGRVVLQLGEDILKVYLKRYNAFSWRYRLGSLFMRSEAHRSWRGAALLSQVGFNVGTALAAVEYRSFGMLAKSFYMSAEVPGSFTVDAFWDAKSKEMNGRQIWCLQKSFIRELAQLFISLHAKDIYHKDLKDANILVQEREGARQYYLTDLEDVSTPGRLSSRRKIKNLVQLDRTLGKKFSRGRRLYFLKVYLQERYKDRAERRSWMVKIVHDGCKADLRYQERHLRLF